MMNIYNHSNPTYSCNLDYFEVINTHEKAYWLGFIYADGCIQSEHKSLIIELGEMDFTHLIKFNNAINSNYKIFHNNRDGVKTCRLTISRNRFVEHLINKGCFPRKTFNLEFPNQDIVPQEFVNSFILGYFDGDGCISTILRKKRNDINKIMECELNFLGTYDFLYGIVNNLPVGSIKIVPRKSIYTFRMASKKNIIAVMDYLYKDSPIYLDRKHDKYINNIKNYITRCHPLRSKQNYISISA